MEKNNKLKDLRAELRRQADPVKAGILQRFFKTGKGQYGEGDVFLGVVVPKQRILAKKYYKDLSLTDLDILIKSKIHEERLLALLILVMQFKQSKILNQKSKIFRFYLNHTKYINNWDLVDLSAPNIIGAYLFGCRGGYYPPKNVGKGFKPFPTNCDILYKLAKSKNLWERRIAILSTLYFIQAGRPDETLKIAEMLMQDEHDLIHKAVGWMLREVGKRISQEIEERFLQKHFRQMPRTMLRYAIERFPEHKRRQYLKQK